MTVSKTRKSTKIPKYKINVVLPFGPFKTSADAEAVKRKLRSRSSNLVTGAVSKTSRGYKFSGRLSYVKQINAPASAIKAYFARSSPGSKVIVTKV